MIKCRNQIERITLAALLASIGAVFILIMKTGIVDSPFYLVIFSLLSFFYCLKASLRYLYLLEIPLFIISFMIVPIYNMPLIFSALTLTFLTSLVYKKSGAGLWYFTSLLFSCLLLEGAELLIKSFFLGIDGFSAYFDIIASLSALLSKYFSSELLNIFNDLAVMFVVLLIFLYDLLVALIALLLIRNIEKVLSIKRRKKRMPSINTTLVAALQFILFLTLTISAFYYTRLPLVGRIIFQVFLGIYIITSILLSLIYPSYYLISKKKTDLGFFLIFIASLLFCLIDSLFAFFFIKHKLKALIQ